MGRSPHDGAWMPVRAGPFLAASWVLFACVMLSIWPRPAVLVEPRSTLWITTTPAQPAFAERVDGLVRQSALLAGIETPHITTRLVSSQVVVDIAWHTQHRYHARAQWETLVRNVRELAEPALREAASEHVLPSPYQAVLDLRMHVARLDAGLNALAALVDTAAMLGDSFGQTMPAEPVVADRNPDQPTDPNSSGTAGTAPDALSVLREKLTTLLLTHTEEHPEVIQLRRQIAELEEPLENVPTWYANFRAVPDNADTIQALGSNGWGAEWRMILERLHQEIDRLRQTLPPAVEALDRLDGSNPPTALRTSAKIQILARPLARPAIHAGGMSPEDWGWVLCVSGLLAVVLWTHLAAAYGVPHLAEEHGNSDQPLGWKQHLVHLLSTSIHLPRSVVWGLAMAGITVIGIVLTAVICARWSAGLLTDLIRDPIWAAGEWWFASPV